MNLYETYELIYPEKTRVTRKQLVQGANDAISNNRVQRENYLGWDEVDEAISILEGLGDITVGNEGKPVDGVDAGQALRRFMVATDENTLALRNGHPDCFKAAVDYVVLGRPCGNFLTALFANDLLGAFGRADEVNIKLMRHWCGWVFNKVPQMAHGSYDVVEQWQARQGMLNAK